MRIIQALCAKEKAPVFRRGSFDDYESLLIGINRKHTIFNGKAGTHLDTAQRFIRCSGQLIRFERLIWFVRICNIRVIVNWFMFGEIFSHDSTPF